jgi:hypothetical protein
MQTATKGTLELGSQTITLTGDAAAKTLKGELGGQAVQSQDQDPQSA